MKVLTGRIKDFWVWIDGLKPKAWWNVSKASGIARLDHGAFDLQTRSTRSANIPATAPVILWPTIRTDWVDGMVLANLSGVCGPIKDPTRSAVTDGLRSKEL